MPIAHPVGREVTDYVDFTGRTEAVQSVDIRPRVTGYLVEMPFQEGAEVKKGDLLFVVDPPALQGPARPGPGPGQPLQGLAQAGQGRPWPATGPSTPCRPARSASSNSTRSRPSSTRPRPGSRPTRRAWRSTTSTTNSPGCISPIDGQISRYYLTLGNLVNQDQTLLTTVVSVDPMYVYFEMDEPTLLRTRRAINEGKLRLPKDGEAAGARWACRARTGFPHQGTINFVNNQVNPTTGSILVRGVFANPRPREATGCSRRACSCGSACRSACPTRRCWSSTGPSASDQGLKYVYVLDAEEQVQYRRVTTGALQDGRLEGDRGGPEAGRLGRQRRNPAGPAAA